MECPECGRETFDPADHAEWCSWWPGADGPQWAAAVFERARAALADLPAGCRFPGCACVECEHVLPVNDG